MTAAAAVPKTVLIIEGNPVDREGLAVILHREGYHPVAVASGQEALDQLRTSPAELILLDATLPDGSAEAFLRQCAADPVLATIPIILAHDAVGGHQPTRGLSVAG